MAEYLAPGVYVEETSFRSKSIEGVSTSTTAFVGPTRRGPVQSPDGGPLELVTSFGDFERVFGGFENLTLAGERTVNYMAHAVNAYFTNGGSRLYVVRTFTPAAGGTGLAEGTQDIVGGGAAADRARVVARFPGQAGNGRVIFYLKELPAVLRSMNSARAGTMIQAGDTAPGPATVRGTATGPFTIANDAVLALTVNGQARRIQFHGTPAAATGDTDLADPAPFAAGSTLRVTIDGGVEQAIVIGAQLTQAELAQSMNEQITGASVRIAANKLIITSDTRGAFASVAVRASAAFGFAQDVLFLSVPNLAAVTAADVDNMLQRAGIAVRATASPDNRLVLTTVATGAAATLQVDVPAGAASAHVVLGLPAAVPVAGAAGNAGVFVKRGDNWVDSGNQNLALAGLQLGDAPRGTARFLSISVEAVDADGQIQVFEDLAFDSRHPRFIGTILGAVPPRRTDQLQNLFSVQVGTGVTAFALFQGLFAAAANGVRTIQMQLGSDGARPAIGAYRIALEQLRSVEDISIVAAPGHSTLGNGFIPVQEELVAHASSRRAYRIAVLDTPQGQSPGEVRELRGRLDSTYAALYYPWIVVANPLSGPTREDEPAEVPIPPSGSVCGVYARSDVNRGVFKAPANEVVRGAIRFEREINFAEQETLNPVAVNCLRYLPGQGNKVWGARVVTSDPEWKYVNVRRYFLYCENSIDRGTQWAVFEPNGERLWANVKDTISQFLYSEWRGGALLGVTPEEAFFVRCDRSTMNQNDLDNGRLVCLIGIAVIKPAEFVIFRIGQKTVDSRG